MINTFDHAVSFLSFEHFHDPSKMLAETMRVVKPGGKILITSSVWCHPWGSHVHFFTKVPWVHFIFSEETIMNVRKLYRNDGATKFSEIEGGLNDIGIAKFKIIIKSLGLHTERFFLIPLRKMYILTHVPLLNEFITQRIVAVLRKPN